MYLKKFFMFLYIMALTSTGLVSNAFASEKDFLNRIDTFIEKMTPYVQSQYGSDVKLIAKPSWKHNSYMATVIPEYKNFNIIIYGGVYRAPYMSPDAFSWVLCHELSHIFQSAPYNQGDNGINLNEGQTDYISNLKCMRYLFKDEDNISYIKKLKIPVIVKDKCEFVFKNKQQAALCIRNSMTALDFTRSIAFKRELEVMPRFDTPDKSIVRTTDKRWPSPQCRLDTLFSAALCNKELDEDISVDSSLPGSCNRAEGYKLGTRPLCWFKPAEITKDELSELGLKFSVHEDFISKSDYSIDDPIYNKKPIFNQENEFEDIEDNIIPQYDFSSIVSLSNCSGSIVRFEGAKDSQKALLLTNGHCVKMGKYSNKYPAPNELIKNKKQLRHVQLYSESGKRTIMLSLKKLILATMTNTDIAIYQLDEDYQTLKEKFSVQPLIISSKPAHTNDKVKIVSGLTGNTDTCEIQSTNNKIKEVGWTWIDSYKLKSKNCNVGKGDSGSPMISIDSNEIVGIYNTSNLSGASRCAIDSPCEVLDDGTTIAFKGAKYGQRINQLYNCLNAKAEIDLSQKSCPLSHAP